MSENYKANTKGDMNLSAALLLLLSLVCVVPRPANAISSDSFGQLVDQSIGVCKPLRIPLLCDRILRYSFNDLTGNCVRSYMNECALGKERNYFLTFEECRRDKMQILRY